jgi:hypothetical protein
MVFRYLTKNDIMIKRSNLKSTIGKMNHEFSDSCYNALYNKRWATITPELHDELVDAIVFTISSGIIDGFYHSNRCILVWDIGRFLEQSLKRRVKH